MPRSIEESVVQGNDTPAALDPQVQPRDDAARDRQAEPHLQVCIEWFETDAGPCVACQRKVGSGPVGYKKDQPSGPLCDECLSDLNRDFGVLMSVVNVNRELANHTPRNRLEEDILSQVLLLYAKIYDVEAQWPRRRMTASKFLDSITRRVVKVPFDALSKMTESEN